MRLAKLVNILADEYYKRGLEKPRVGLSKSEIAN